MIHSIKYSINAKTYSLINNGDNTWTKDLYAPSVIGNYSMNLEINEDDSLFYIDSSDARYGTYLKIIESTEERIYLEEYLPKVIRDIFEFNVLYNVENSDINDLNSNIKKIKNDLFLTSASNDAIERIERFMRVKGQGTLEQRKSYIKALLQKGKKINKRKIKEIVNTIAGSDCIITFFATEELNNPDPGFGLLQIQVLSPDNNKDYRYEDILRSVKPLIPGHIKLFVIKYFALWEDAKIKFADWTAISEMKDWQGVKDYIPPQ